MYTGSDFADGLESQLAQGFDSVRIARWAYQTYFDNVRELEPGLNDKIMSIVLIEEPQFEMSKEELQAFISSLR